jgi:hypothetical protein
MGKQREIGKYGGLGSVHGMLTIYNYNLIRREASRLCDFQREGLTTVRPRGKDKTRKTRNLLHLIVLLCRKVQRVNANCNSSLLTPNSLRNWIMPVSTPRVATCKPLGGEAKCLKKSIFLKCLYPILTAGWGVATTARKQGRNSTLIQAYQQNRQSI